MPLALITNVPTHTPRPARAGKPMPDRRFEALLMQSFVEMRARTTRK